MPDGAEAEAVRTTEEMARKMPTSGNRGDLAARNADQPAGTRNPASQKLHSCICSGGVSVCSKLSNVESSNDDETSESDWRRMSEPKCGKCTCFFSTNFK